MKLDKKNPAIIFKSDNDIELALPKFNEDSLVSDEILFATAIAILLQSKDKDFLKVINRQIKKMIKETKEDV